MTPNNSVQAMTQYLYVLLYITKGGEWNECVLPCEHFWSWPVDVRRLPAQVGYTDAIEEANEYAEQ